MKLKYSIRQKNLSESYTQLQELKAYGYKVEEFETWHWRISYPDSDMEVDVWPTSKKYWIKGSYQGSSEYKDLFETIHSLFFKKK